MSAKQSGLAGPTFFQIEFIPISLAPSDPTVSDNTDVHITVAIANNAANGSAVSITYVPVNLQTVTEGGDNGLRRSALKHLTAGQTMPGTDLAIPPHKRHGRRKLKLVRQDTTKLGTLVIIAEHFGVAVATTIEVGE